MKKTTLFLGLVLISLFSFGQLDITKRTVTLDSINARSTVIYMNDSVYIRDTSIYDLMQKYVTEGTMTIGTDGEIPFVNDASTDLEYSTGFIFDGNTLELEADSGDYNIAIGKYCGSSLISSSGYNVFIGNSAGYYTTGNYNIFIGSAGTDNTTGSDNVFIGDYAGADNTTGSDNVFIGDDAGADNTTGSDNVFIGTSAGNSSTGSDNVFIGTSAGETETGSNRLHIANSSDKTLIYGEFDNDSIVINGDLRVSGMIRQSSTWELFGGFQDSTVLVDLTEDVYSQVTNDYGTLWTGLVSDGFVISGDTSQFINGGNYAGTFSVTFTGTAGIVYQFRVWNITQNKQEGFLIAETGNGSTDYTTITKPLRFVDITAGDKLILQVTNIDNDTDITFLYGSYDIKYIHD